MAAKYNSGTGKKQDASRLARIANPAPAAYPWRMSHASNIVHCSGPTDPHALDGISTRHRTGDLDRRCPLCAGHGQWNSQIDLVSQRSIRVPCPKCDGRGWIETGADMVPSHDIALSPEGRPEWVVRLDPSDDIE